MSRPVFWPTRDAQVTDSFGSAVAGQRVRVYAAQSGGSPVTDLTFVDASGTPTTAVPSGILVSDSNGLLPAFAGPDGGADVLFGDFGAYGVRLALVADPSSAGAGSGTFAQIVEVDARSYGVVANGATDSSSLTANTAALQAFVTAVLTTKKAGVLPVGTIHINGQINFSAVPVWRIRGAGRAATVIMQHASNTPILNLGSDTVSFMHTWSLSGFSLDYSTSQPSTNALANPILFSTMAFNGELRDVSFDRGSYAIRVADGIGGPWGNSWDDLQFGGSLTLGAMDWTNAVNAVPNNHWGRFTVHCDNAVGPIFKGMRGYNWRIDTIEFLSANFGPCLMEFTAGVQVSVGTLKVEVSTWTASRSLFAFLGNNVASIDQIFFGNSSPTVNSLPAGQSIVIVSSGASATNGGFIHIGSIDAGNFSSVTDAGAAYVLNAGPGAPIVVDRVNYGSNWALTNVGAAASADSVTVSNYVNHRVSQDRGDADYTAVLSDPNLNVFGTAFTAQRTINLPSVNGDLFSGLYYEFTFNGAINGSNAAVIKCGATTLRTQVVDGVVLRYTYRRHPSSAALGWLLTKNENIAGSATADEAFLDALIYGG